MAGAHERCREDRLVRRDRYLALADARPAALAGPRGADRNGEAADRNRADRVAGAAGRLHAQASQLIGSDAALAARIRSLRGYPIVVNAWESYCQPCQKEFGLFANASIQYGRQVAFIGADANDTPGDARVFLREHHVSYPSYPTSTTDLGKLVPGGDRGISDDDLHRPLRADRRSPRRPVRIAEHAGCRSRPLRDRRPLIGGGHARGGYPAVALSRQRWSESERDGGPVVRCARMAAALDRHPGRTCRDLELGTRVVIAYTPWGLIVAAFGAGVVLRRSVAGSLRSCRGRGGRRGLPPAGREARGCC